MLFGNTRTVLAAISDKFVRPTILVILAQLSVALAFPRLAGTGWCKVPIED